MLVAQDGTAMKSQSWNGTTKEADQGWWDCDKGCLTQPGSEEGLGGKETTQLRPGGQMRRW